jgi:hypothetical protein
MAKDSKPESDADEGLKRLGGGRWETRDGRFTIEPASGTWSVLDTEETDDLGLPLVRGPFRSLTDAKAAIAMARESAAPASPLADRVRERQQPPVEDEARKTEGAGSSAKRARERSGATEAVREAEEPRQRGSGPAKAAAATARKPEPDEAEAEAEPGWFRDLSAADRGRARRLIERLTKLGIEDADSIVRRDLVGEVPAIAAAALERRLAGLPADAGIGDVVELLVDGRDDDLGVRWRVVDGDGRPILVDVRALRRGRP